MLNNIFLKPFKKPKTFTLTNKLGTDGNFINSAGGLGSGWGTFQAGVLSVLNNIQHYTATAQYGQVSHGISAVNTHKYYGCVFFKSSSNTVTFEMRDGAFPTNVVANSGNNNFEFASILLTASSTNTGNIKVVDSRASGWNEIQFKLVVVLDLTAIFGVGKEPTKATMDYKIQNCVSRYGYINGQKIKL